jgi:hypothetical protein
MIFYMLEEYELHDNIQRTVDGAYRFYLYNRTMV